MPRLRNLVSWVLCGSIVAAGTTSCAARQEKSSAEFCAIMTDSVGLYVDNSVTQMGYKIGTVKSITPGDEGVEVRFVLTEDRSIPLDVKAVIRSTSILADRSLELVGNYHSGPRLAADQCIPKDHSFTPLSISQVIGSATNLVNGISPDGSEAIKGALGGVDAALQGNGAALNNLLTTSSELLDNPDQQIAEIGSIVRNVVQLTDMIKDNRPQLKTILQDTPAVASEGVKALGGVSGLANAIHPLSRMMNDFEEELGDDIQLALDATADSLRHASPHYKGIANMLNPVPRFVNTLSYYANNKELNLIRWRPPLFRIQLPDGGSDALLMCGTMNASMPGSCADVNGQPHAVDVALLQYVLTEAQRR